MFKDIRDLELTIIKEKTMTVQFHFENGKTIKFSQVSIAIIKNPFKNGKLDFAVMPYFKNDSGEFVPVYTYQEDIQYQEYRKIISECKRRGITIHYAVEDFVKEMAQRKCKACEWANLVINNTLEETQKVDNTLFPKQVWRDTVTTDNASKKLMAEAVEELK